MNDQCSNDFSLPVNSERIMLIPPFNVVMAARIKGPIGVGAVRSAVEALRTRHALLAVRVQFDANGDAQYRADGVSELRVREVAVKDGENIERLWQQEVMRECRRAFPLETGPLVRFVLVRNENWSYLLVTGHHAICDGKSLTYLIRDVLEVVSSPEALPVMLPAPPAIDRTTVPGSRQLPWMARVILRQMRRMWEKKHLSFDRKDRERLHQTFWEQNSGAMVLAWALTRDQTNELMAACRAEGVTVNSALWTAFLLSQREVQGNTSGYRKMAGMAVSTRDRLNVPVGEAFGFYASSLSLALPVDSKANFWDAARQVQVRIRKTLGKTDLFRMLVAKALPPSLLDSLYFNKYGLLNDSMSARMLRKLRWDRVSYGYTITNVGKSNISTSYGPHKLEAVYGPFFYSDVNEKVVGVSTVGDVLTFALTCNASLVGADVATRLKASSLAYLKHAITIAMNVKKVAPSASLQEV